jgi:hypothetical protein
MRPQEKWNREDESSQASQEDAETYATAQSEEQLRVGLLIGGYK